MKIKLSHLASLRNASDNSRMLNFARAVLEKEQFEQLHRSYKSLFWFQLSLPIAAAVLIPVLCLIFKEYAVLIACFGAVLFLFLFIIWLILSQFLVGRMWHKYVKLYKSDCHPNVIKQDLFG